MDSYNTNSYKRSRTSSTQSHNNQISPASSINENGGNLEYLTSSSSSSPQFYNVVTRSSEPSPVASVVSVISNRSDESNASTSSFSSLAQVASRVYEQEEIMKASSSSQDHIVTNFVQKVRSGRQSSQISTTSNKRRRVRESIDYFDDSDPEVGFEPSAKRQQCHLPTEYESDVAPASVASSVYDELPEHNTLSQICSPLEGFPDNIPESPNNSEDYSAENYCADDQHNYMRGSQTDDHEYDTVSSTTNSSVRSSSTENISAPFTSVHENPLTPAEPLIQRPKVRSFDELISSYCMTPAAETEPLRQCPLPSLTWANAYDVWQVMCRRDEEEAHSRDPRMISQHPGLEPRMRSILFDWLTEVSEVYRLHRETYYLAVDYIDRYLTAKDNLPKTHLQLLGITCLFIAAKVEEIYPPKINEFAYVTDGACEESEILQQEILVLKALNWRISPVTPMGWLGVYMQLNVDSRTPASFKTNKPHKVDESNSKDAFLYPQFSGFEFVQTARLLDLCSLDILMADFSYSILAAAAMCHTFDRETALRCSGLEWRVIEPCAIWMEPYFHVICEEAEHIPILEQNENILNKFGLGHICPNINTDDSYIMQTHTTTMAMFDRATLLNQKIHTVRSVITSQASPATGLISTDGILTPPTSSRKTLDGDEIEEEEEIDLDNNNKEKHFSNNIVQVTLTKLPAPQTAEKSLPDSEYTSDLSEKRFDDHSYVCADHQNAKHEHEYDESD